MVLQINFRYFGWKNMLFDQQRIYTKCLLLAIVHQILVQNLISDWNGSKLQNKVPAIMHCKIIIQQKQLNILGRLK